MKFRRNHFNKLIHKLGKEITLFTITINKVIMNEMIFIFPNIQNVHHKIMENSIQSLIHKFTINEKKSFFPFI